MKANQALAIGLVALAVVFVGFAIFYTTTDTGLLADKVARHYKHAILFAGLAVLSLVAANFAWRRPALS